MCCGGELQFSSSHGRVNDGSRSRSTEVGLQKLVWWAIFLIGLSGRSGSSDTAP